MARLVITADVDGPGAAVSIKARLELEVAHEVRVLLLDDRGWSSTGLWTDVSVEDVRYTTLKTVGPDEPFGDLTTEDMERDHWTSLQQAARRHGVAMDAEQLRSLPRDVVLTPLLLDRMAGS